MIFGHTGCPTRASLMTGLYPHEAGVGHMVYSDRGAGYYPYLNKECVTIAEVLRDSGYRTMMTGKWHVCHQAGQWPTDRGFDHFYGIHIHVDSYFKVLENCPVYHNGKLVIQPTANPKNDLHPDQEWYATDIFTDWSLKFLDEAADDNKPFFLYTAYNSPHWPLEAPYENIANFKGKYADGWDALTPEQRVDFDHGMAIYAVVMHRLDRSIGTLVSGLKVRGELDNTLLLFLSDNGASAEGGRSAAGRAGIAMTVVSSRPRKEYEFPLKIFGKERLG